MLRFSKGRKVGFQFQRENKTIFKANTKQRHFHLCDLLFLNMLGFKIFGFLKQVKREMARERRSAREMWSWFTIAFPPCPVCIFRNHSSNLLCIKVISFLNKDDSLGGSSNMTKCRMFSLGGRSFQKASLKLVLWLDSTNKSWKLPRTLRLLIVNSLSARFYLHSCMLYTA